MTCYALFKQTSRLPLATCSVWLPMGENECTVHPLSISAFRLSAVSRLGSGDPAAPENDYLPLLPSGPDGVRRFSPRRTRSSTPLSRRSPTMPDLEREFNPAVADCGYRAPLVPRLARPLILPKHARQCQASADRFTPRRKGRQGLCEIDTTADRCTRPRAGGIVGGYTRTWRDVSASRGRSRPDG